MTGTYAAGTDVPVDRSRAELERTLVRYGATHFVYGWEGDRVMVSFGKDGRTVRFVIPMPDRAAPAFTRTPTGKVRKPQAALAEWEQACRQRWRALNLVVKAKLEAVDAGIASFEDEFMAYVLLPGGSTVADWARPAIADAYDTGTLPSPLALGSGR